MTNKMKGLLKGLRYISQIFDEEKEQEMQIGLPTDVKHVAHIGWDGPAADSPGWMNDFEQPTGKSAPLGPHGDSKDNSQIKWVSEDSKRSKSINNSDHSPKKKDPSTKPRQSRKHQSKESSNKQQQDDSGMDATTGTSSSPPRGLPDIPKKTRRKKSKDSVNGGGSMRSRKSTASNNNGTANSLNSENGPELSQAPSVNGDEETENRVTLRE